MLRLLDRYLGRAVVWILALAGAAILSDGRVGLILEPRTLVQPGRGLEAAA